MQLFNDQEVSNDTIAIDHGPSGNRFYERDSRDIDELIERLKSAGVPSSHYSTKQEYLNSTIRLLGNGAATGSCPSSSKLVMSHILTIKDGAHYLFWVQCV